MYYSKKWRRHQQPTISAKRRQYSRAQFYADPLITRHNHVFGEINVLWDPARFHYRCAVANIAQQSQRRGRTVPIDSAIPDIRSEMSSEYRQSFYIPVTFNIIAFPVDALGPIFSMSFLSSQVASVEFFQVTAASGFNSECGLVSITSLLLWDIFVTLPREKIHIWSYHSKTNWTTLFYTITRYLPLLVSGICLSLPQFNIVNEIGNDWTPSGQLVKRLSILYIAPWFLVLCCTEILFIRRIVALHGGSKLLLQILTCLFICELTSAFVIFFVYTFVNESVAHLTVSSGGLEISVGTTVSFSETYFVFPELIFQAVLVILIMKKVISDWKWGITRSNIGSTLIRDGLWSYFFNLCCLLIILIRPSWLSGPIGLPNILWSYVSFSVTSTRLILNLRETAAKQSGTNTVDRKTSTAVGSQTHLGIGRNILAFITSATDELSVPYHYHDFGHDSDSDSDD